MSSIIGLQLRAKMANKNGIEKKKVSDITSKSNNNSLDLYPNIKTFLEILLKDVDIETRQVGKKFLYPSSVERNKHFCSHGIVMEYFIRKLLSNKFSLKLEDPDTDIVLNDKSTYFQPQTRCLISSAEIEKHYKIYTDPNTRAMAILESIKKVSFSKILQFQNQLPIGEVDVNPKNLIEVQKYIDKLPYSKVEMHPEFDCDYFEGRADMIFDRKVMIELKTSKFSSLSRLDDKIGMRFFNKMILYAFGYYKKTGIIIKHFKIYNPLWGQEHEIKINDIDMTHFEEVLKKDLMVSCKSK